MDNELMKYGLMQRYKESLRNTPGPVLLKDLPPLSIDYRGLVSYARSKGVQPGLLSEEEKASFIRPMSDSKQKE